MSGASEKILRSLPPIAGASSRILVLGSMPGRRSLELGQYYAHPQNSFWRIVERAFGIACNLPYAQRTSALTESGLALWDVAASCEREGSLDSDIRNAVPNDFDLFFRRFPAIERIFFNGTKAARLWAGLVTPRGHFLASQTLPSTSPANATMSFEAKYRAWGDAIGGERFADL